MATIEQTAVAVSDYEIDFFAVGDGSRSGDAIVIRLGDLDGSVEDQVIVVVDGGYSDNGDAIVNFVRDVIGRDRVDLVISTHPDQDHVSGLSRVLAQLDVDELWMHLPWDHTEDIAKMFDDGRVTDNGISKKLRAELTGVRLLADVAESRGVPIVEPFTGLVAFGGAVQVLGPTETFYEDLLVDFRSTPDPAPEGVLAKIAAIAKRFAEKFDIETLTDGGTTSAENRTSVITLFDVGGNRVLLTGDAGIESLENAADELESRGLLGHIDLIQVPHHGSRHNVGPTILDRLIGPKLDAEKRKMIACVSAAKDGAPRHPSRQVTNAFRRRGAPVWTNANGQLTYNSTGTLRAGWVPIDPLPFYVEVEE